MLRETVARWETGKTTPVQANVLLDIADVLEVSLRWLLGRASEEGETTMRVSHDELDLIRLYRNATPQGKKLLLESFRQVQSIRLGGR